MVCSNCRRRVDAATFDRHYFVCTSAGHAYRSHQAQEPRAGDNFRDLASSPQPDMTRIAREHIVVDRGATETAIRFDRKSISDRGLIDRLTTALSIALSQRRIATTIEREVLATLCVELLSSDKSNDDRRRVIKSVVARYHSDRRPTMDDLGRATRCAQSAGAVFGLVKDGRIELGRADDSAIIKIKDPS